MSCCTGKVQWPQPKAGALNGMRMLHTGVYETIDRPDLIRLLEACGADYCTEMRHDLNYLLVGRDAGPVKMQIARERGITQFSEQQFYHWTREKIGDDVKPKNEEKGEMDPKNKSNAPDHKKIDTSDEKRESCNKLKQSCRSARGSADHLQPKCPVVASAVETIVLLDESPAHDAFAAPSSMTGVSSKRHRNPEPVKLETEVRTTVESKVGIKRLKSQPETVEVIEL